MPSPEAPVLQARGLEASLPAEGRAQGVLLGVDLELRAGEAVDLVGPSGAGKTMLLRALARLLPGARGELRLRGASAEDLTPERWRALVMLVPQVPVVWPGTVRDNLAAAWRLRVRQDELEPDDADLREALAEVGLPDIELGRDAARLSVGQRSRVALLRAALTGPAVLLLDEPDANLDDSAAEAVAAFTARFAAGGSAPDAFRAVLRVRHLQRGEPCDRRLRLEAGRLTEEGPVRDG